MVSKKYSSLVLTLLMVMSGCTGFLDESPAESINEDKSKDKEEESIIDSEPNKNPTL